MSKYSPAVQGDQMFVGGVSSRRYDMFDDDDDDDDDEGADDGGPEIVADAPHSHSIDDDEDDEDDDDSDGALSDGMVPYEDVRSDRSSCLMCAVLSLASDENI